MNVKYRKHSCNISRPTSNPTVPSDAGSDVIVVTIANIIPLVNEGLVIASDIEQGIYEAKESC